MRRKPAKDAGEWRAARDAYLMRHTRCERCTAKFFEKGRSSMEAVMRVAPATVVHHIRNRSMGKRDHSPENLIALCESCHRWAHAHPAAFREEFERRRDGNAR